MILVRGKNLCTLNQLRQVRRLFRDNQSWGGERLRMKSGWGMERNEGGVLITAQHLTCPVYRKLSEGINIYCNELLQIRDCFVQKKEI